MSQRARLTLYLVGVHLAVGALAVWRLRDQPAWLLAIEVSIGLSLAGGLWLTRRLLSGLDFVHESPQWLADSDFTSRFRAVGQAEIDGLITTYNRMIDELRAARVAAQEQQQFLAQVMDVSPAGLLVLDYEGRVASINPAAERLCGVTADLLQGQPLDRLRGPLGREIASLPAGEHRLVSPGDGRRLRLIHGTFVDRGFRRSFFSVEELTEEVRRLERAAHEKLIRLLSHEVNNTVGASASLLHSCLIYAPQVRDADRADFERALHVVIDRTTQLNDFMRSFADVYRLPAPRRQRVDLIGVAGGLGALVRAQCDARGIQWTAVLPERPVAVDIDRGQVEQALLNVVKNAMEAAGEGGRVTLRLREDRGRIRLDIEDSGPGLSEAARANLFTPFFSTKEHGQGLGLTLVQEVLGNHDLPFSLDGPPGGPTVFSVWFTSALRA